MCWRWRLGKDGKFYGCLVGLAGCRHLGSCVDLPACCLKGPLPPQVPWEAGILDLDLHPHIVTCNVSKGSSESAFCFTPAQSLASQASGVFYRCFCPRAPLRLGWLRALGRVHTLGECRLYSPFLGKLIRGGFSRSPV